MKAVRALIIVEDGDAGVVDPGFGVRPPTDPGYGRPGFAPGRPDQGLPPFQGRPDQGLPGSPGHPGNELPVPPVRPSPPITLPPGVWPPQLPPSVDNSLPPGTPPETPIVIPPDPSVGIENPIVIPFLPPGSALLIALPPAPPGATPKEPVPANTKPAILVQPGKKPVLVYVSAAATPK